MYLDRSKLASVLDTLKLSTGNKHMEVAFYVKFVIDTDEHAVYLATTNFQSFMVINMGDVSMTAITDVPKLFLIKFKELHDLIKASTTETVGLFGSEDGNHIRLVTDGEYEFPVFNDPDMFPVADFEHEVAGYWEAADLSSIWSRVAMAVSRDFNKISYQGVHFDGNWAATDNRRLSIVMDDDPAKVYEGDSMLIPIVLGDIISRCQGEVTIGRNQQGNMLVVSCEKIGMAAAIRLLDADFADYQMLLDRRKDHIKLTLPKMHLTGIINRLSCFTDKLYKTSQVQIIRGLEGARIRCSIDNKVSGVEEIDALDFEFDNSLPHEGQVAEYQYQIDNMADAVAATQSKEEVHVSFDEHGKMWIDEDNFHHLLANITS